MKDLSAFTRLKSSYKPSPRCNNPAQTLLRTIVLAGLALLPAGAIAATFNVSIVDNEFIPKILTIAPGDTVVWTNNGGEHTVTADSGAFDSGTTGANIPSGATFTVSFPNAGRNPYFCLLHGGPGGQDMSGVVRVVDPSSNHPPATPTNTSPAAGAVGQSLGPTLTASTFSDEDTDDVHLASQWIVRTVNPSAVVLDTGTDSGNKTSLTLADLENNTVYAWKVRYRDDIGAWSDYSAETQFTTVALPTSEGTGLTATYAKYNVKTEVPTVLLTTVDPTVDFNWGLAKPNLKTPANNFFVRWEGTVLPQYSESYRFRVVADGGVRLWVNGIKIIDDWVKPPFAVFRNNITTLQAGVAVPIKLEYFDTLGAASVSLRWSSPSQPTVVIPKARLFPVQ